MRLKKYQVIEYSIEGLTRNEVDSIIFILKSRESKGLHDLGVRIESMLDKL